MRGLKPFLLCAVVAIVWLSPAAAMVHESVLVGSGYFGLGSIPLHAEALFDEGVWTYTYVAEITGVTADVTGFTIANLDQVPFSYASNDKNFQNPVYFGADSILWNYGNVAANDGPIAFSFKSSYSPALVQATLWGGTRSSFDYTLGPMPEPGSLAGMAVFGLGSAGLFYRRRSNRR